MITFEAIKKKLIINYEEINHFIANYSRNCKL